MGKKRLATGEFGLCQWFHLEDRDAVRLAISLLKELGVKKLRTALSWADHYRRGGEAWHDWMLGELRAAGIDVLLAVWHTPPSISETGGCSGPPRRLRDYADFIDTVISRYDGCFEALELWNEPNNRIKWNFRDCDPQWEKFGEMIRDAANWAQHRGCMTVLGGMIPVDPAWLRLMRDYGALDHIDVVGIHAFPEMWAHEHSWWDWPEQWRGWENKIESIRKICGGREIWVTETGLATWDDAARKVAREQKQIDLLHAAMDAPAERIYWYSLQDLAPQRPCIEMTEDGGRVDRHEYHMGLVTADERRKPAFSALRRLAGDPG